MIRSFLVRCSLTAVVSALAALPLVTTSTPVAAAGTCTKVVTSSGLLLPADSNNNTGCIMGQGNTSPAVKELQLSLNTCYGFNLATDGIFGPKTKAALQAVQSFEGTTPDGVYGPHTRDAIQHRIAAARSFCAYL